MSQSQNMNRENLRKALSYEKRARKILMKLTIRGEKGGKERSKNLRVSKAKRR